MILYTEYPGLSPLFLEFLKGSDLYPDRPTVEAAAERGRQLIAAGRPARVAASAFRCRGAKASRMAVPSPSRRDTRWGSSRGPSSRS